MSSSMLTVYPQLPPTTNTLNSQQRTRLMRSTRKLGAVLGTTPYLLESDTSFAMLPLGRTTSRVLKRQGSIFTHHQVSSLSVATTSIYASSSHHPSASTSSIALPVSVGSCTQSTERLPANPPGLSASRRLRPGDKTPQLYLRLDPVSVPPTDERVAQPLTPRTPITPTPVTPTVPDIAEIRRKRMAKLARHLGEVIPVGLVVPSETAPKHATVSPGRSTSKGRSQSVDVLRTKDPRVSESRPSFAKTKPDWTGEWNRSNINDVQKELRKLRVK